MNINSLLEGANPLQNQQNEAAKLASKWERSGLLEGLNAHESEKANMAVLLENQARQLVQEASQQGTGANIAVGSSEAFAGVALPLVRRVFGEIVAKDLLSVQPMNLPSGLIFYLDFQYGTTQTANFSANDSLYGASSDLTRTELPDTSDNNPAAKGLYGAGRFGYSINETGSEIPVSGYSTASAEFAGILNLDTEFSASHAGQFGAATGKKVVTVVVPTGSIPEFDPEGIRAFDLAAAANLTVGQDYPQFTRLNGSNIEFVVAQDAADTTMGAITVTYQKGPDNLDDRGDFADGTVNDQAFGDNVSNLNIPEINVQLQSDTVTAKTRKLKAQ